MTPAPHGAAPQRRPLGSSLIDRFAGNSPGSSPADGSPPWPQETTVNSRHPGDGVRIAVGLSGLLVLFLAVQRDDLSIFEIDVFRLINDLPSWLAQLLGPLMQLGNVLATPVLALVALVLTRRRWRVAFDILMSGGLAWFAARVIKGLVERPRPSGLIDEINRISGSAGFGFVSGHAAVAAALVTAVAPYLPRRARRAVWALPLVVGAARVFYGVHLPLDIVGGAALGWVIGSGVHLLIGAPHRVPDLDEASAVLRSAGVEPTRVERASGNARGSFPFVASVGGGTVFVKLLDPEPRDRDWIYRAARFLVFRDVRDEAAIIDASAQAHREAAMALLARSHGVCTPAVLGIESHRGRVWMVQDHVPGTSLDLVAPDAVSDRALASLWDQLNILRRARIAHRDLVASNVILGGDGRVWLVDFAHAQSSTAGHALDNDVAELLVSTALVVGTDRAVRAAATVLGADRLCAALPELQPFVLTAETRDYLRQRNDLLADLRTVVMEVSDCQVRPDTTSTSTSNSNGLRRLTISLASVGAVVALTAIAGIGEVVDVLSTPGYRWLGLAVVCVAVARVAGATLLLAAIDRPLALGRTLVALLFEERHQIFDGRRQGQVHLVEHLERAGVGVGPALEGLSRRRVTGLATLALAGGSAAAAVLAADVFVDVRSELVALGIVALGIFCLELLARDHAWPRRPWQVRSGVPWRSGSGLGTQLAAGGVELFATVVVVVSVLEAMGGGAVVVGAAAVAVTVQILAALGPVARAPGLAMVVMAIGLGVVGTPLAVAVTAAMVSRALVVWVPVGITWLVSDSVMVG